MMGLDPLIVIGGGPDTAAESTTPVSETVGLRRILLGVLVFLATAHIWLLADMAAWLQAADIAAGSVNLYGFLAIAGWIAVSALGVLWFALLALFEVSAVDTENDCFVGTNVLGLKTGGTLGRPVRLFQVVLIGFSEQRPIRRATVIWGYAMPMVVSESLVKRGRLVELLTPPRP